MEARHLQAGDLLLLRNGDLATVEELASRREKLKVYNLEVADLHTYAVGSAGVVVHNRTPGGQPFAMGLTDQGLEAFANARGATTWKQLPDPENWQSGVLEKLADPETPVHFNLDGVDVWEGVQRAASGRGGPTDWELLQMQQNPQFWESLQFWKDGQPAPNPFK